MSFYRILDAPQRKKRRNTCSNFWATSEWSPPFSIVGLFMGGCSKTSTHDVTVSDPLSPSSKSKMGTASAATPTLSGHLTGSMLVIVMPCCSTSLAKGTSQTNEQATRYSVAAVWGLVLVEVAVS
jgi:hypothetical protein